MLPFIALLCILAAFVQAQNSCTQLAVPEGLIDLSGLAGHIYQFVYTPDPDHIISIAIGKNVPASDLCFVGDHPVNDVQGSARMGMTPVWVAGHHAWPDDLEPPAWQIESLSELILLLAKIEGDSKHG